MHPRSDKIGRLQADTAGDYPVYETAKETLMYRTVLWTL